MNPMFAASLFDNPWILAAVILGGALVNWLTQRRQARQQEQPPPPTAKTENDIEEALRRLLGEPAKPPAPPPLPRHAPPRLPPPPPPPARQGVPAAPPIPTWFEESNIILVPPPIAIAEASPDESVRRFEQLTEAGRHPAIVDHPRRSRRAVGAQWRDRKSLRQAFVASLVFGPPKGLES